jgi:hypothetical protein
LRAARATRTLEDAARQASPNQLLVLLGAALVERSALCGNQVCEAGERAPAGASGLGAHARKRLIWHRLTALGAPSACIWYPCLEQGLQGRLIVLLLRSRVLQARSCTSACCAHAH